MEFNGNVEVIEFIEVWGVHQCGNLRMALGSNSHIKTCPLSLLDLIHSILAGSMH